MIVLAGRLVSDALPDAKTLERIKVDYDFPAGTGAVHDIMMPHTSGRPHSRLNLICIYELHGATETQSKSPRDR